MSKNSNTPKTDLHAPLHPLIWGIAGTLVTVLLITLLLVLFGFSPNNNASRWHSGMMGSNYSDSNNTDNSMMMMDHSNMTMGSMMVSNDREFLDEMIPHHQEAVDTSEIILQQSNNSELKEFAQNVITNQNKEIQDMRSWYADWYGQEYSDSGEYQSMMRPLESLDGRDLDKTYIADMIRHHQGAIMMARQAQGFSQREEIKALAGNIVTTQSQEITELNRWLRD